MADALASRAVAAAGRAAGTLQVPPSAGSLRRETLDIHRETEQHPFIVDLMAGRLALRDLARFTGQLRTVYAALEALLEPHRADPVLGRLFDRRLDRLAAIDHDLAALAGVEAASLADPLPETADYAARIREAAGNPARLVAHHYVRYLGDLSGGQIIAMLVRRHYRVPDDALTFYAFPGIESLGGFKTRYRRDLDTLFADPDVYAQVVAEARIAYAANGRVFAGLDRFRS